jgi:hypothetical protein
MKRNHSWVEEGQQVTLSMAAVVRVELHRHPDAPLIRKWRPPHRTSVAQQSGINLHAGADDIFLCAHQLLRVSGTAYPEQSIQRIMVAPGGVLRNRAESRGATSHCHRY